ncbi:unnamed protein product [Thelazia callipaeda]|uniref:Coatomer subunit zeta n=1 Tax=Thelazia callipaeda TaxID=103827 RepID=A0A0N5D7I4_THECL|nr:unnamed protein product [Thelazia callipaeda]
MCTHCFLVSTSTLTTVRVNSARASAQYSNELNRGKKYKQEDSRIRTSIKEGIEESNPNMVPKPYDDLFIEPAGDYDVVYADYNTTLVYLIFKLLFFDSNNLAIVFKKLASELKKFQLISSMIDTHLLNCYG